MVDVFAEVNEELKDEEFNRWLKKFGPKIIVLSVLLIIFTAGRVIYSNNKLATNEKQTVILSELVDVEEDALNVIKAGSQNLNASHKFLSDFLMAEAYIEEGNLVEANKVYETIISNGSVSQEYKDVATIYIVQNILNMDNGDLSKADKLIKPMLFKDNAFYYRAIEQKAFIEAKSGNTEEAKSILENLSSDYDAPSSVRARAEKFKTLY